MSWHNAKPRDTEVESGIHFENGPVTHTKKEGEQLLQEAAPYDP